MSCVEEKKTELFPANWRRRKYPKLWEADSSYNEIHKNHHLLGEEDTKEESFHRARTVPKENILPFSALGCSSSECNKPFVTRFIIIQAKTLVVAQQFSLSVLFLAAHRCVVCRSTEEQNIDYCHPCYRDDDLLISMHIFTATLTIIGLCASIARRQNQTINIGRKRDRFQRRSVDAILIAATLRFLSSVLRTLTASYSSDTVAALAIGGMICSVAAADYNYANGVYQKAPTKQNKTILTDSERQRPAFLGGTVSLNCVFFSAALLASRLTSDTMSYFFFMWTVIFFAYYPETRCYLAQSNFGKIVSCAAIAGISISSWCLLNVGLEKTILLTAHVYFLIVTPLWKSFLLKQKLKIRGPWDIVSLKREDK